MGFSSEMESRQLARPKTLSPHNLPAKACLLIGQIIEATCDAIAAMTGSLTVLTVYQDYPGSYRIKVSTSQGKLPKELQLHRCFHSACGRHNIMRVAVRICRSRVLSTVVALPTRHLSEWNDDDNDDIPLYGVASANQDGPLHSPPVPPRTKAFLRLAQRS